jgi:hypothetical protein
MKKVLERYELEQFSRFCQALLEKRRVLITLKLHIQRLMIKLKIKCHLQDRLLLQIDSTFLQQL